MALTIFSAASGEKSLRSIALAVTVMEGELALLTYVPF
jgi:hypothetical protein